MHFKLYVDGQEIPLPKILNDLKVVACSHPQDGPIVQVHHTFTHEGLVLDVLDEAEAPEENVFTEVVAYEDLIDRAFEAQDNNEPLYRASTRFLFF